VRGGIYENFADVETRKKAIEDFKKVLILSPGFHVTLAHRDVLTGQMAVIGPKEITHRISVLETETQKRNMKELVEALLNAPTIDQRWVVVGILTKRPREMVADEEGIKMLIEALGKQDSEICRAAAYVLRFWPDERAFKPLLRCVGVYGDSWGIAHADYALDNVEKKIDRLSVINELYTQALTDQDPAIRETAVKRFQTRPKVRIFWLDQEGKPLGAHESERFEACFTGITKDTKPSFQVDSIAQKFKLPTKTSKGQKIEYQIQTEDNRYLDFSETWENNLKKLGIDTLSVKMKIIQQDVKPSTPPMKGRFQLGSLFKR
jgi:hypothetical protein